MCSLGLKGTYGAVSIRPAAAILPGRRQIGTLCDCYGALLLMLRSVTIVDASTGHVVTSLTAENVYELGFSPLGTFVITWQRPSKDEKGDAVKNLTVWRVIESGDNHSVVGRFVQKSQTGWNLQYTHDEKYCARSVTNEVQFYESGNLSTVWNKLRVEGVSDFAVSPGETNSIAVFIPEHKVRLPEASIHWLD